MSPAIVGIASFSGAIKKKEEISPKINLLLNYPT